MTRRAYVCVLLPAAPGCPADWGVLRMTLVSFAATSTVSSGSSSAGSSSGGEVTFLAERSEGDAMHLA